ncbi:AraC family transcriptional regulator [Paractinoplanes abujensis]|uniref:AraC-like DNA-binding protein n=1 Tax=Paractinoplanes abujensis TaxID=882441 RepID=A0A7W7CPT9_9ACTN|nr:AraC family transcriptional regulator [Actinoplanes abujensis]MBB4690666.1 AraC-like DNA-binding protein [Actinoplanes abujensis]GID17920.1 AraC family transcriptional regulator [Actinoplanes abujensis]
MSVHADPLEDVLALVGASSSFSAGLVAGGDWAVSFAPTPAVKFNAVRRGRCLLLVADVTYELNPGDCFLLTRPVAFTLASDLTWPTIPAAVIFAGGTGRAGTGDDVFLLGGRFDFGERARELLLDALPPVVHVPGASPSAATVRWALEQIETEMRERPLGAALVAEHLALVMLIHVLRLHVSLAPPDSGWLAGLADPVVGPALRLLHGEPAYAWTVAELASRASVSRSTMAARFRRVVGQGPLEYLTRWRIELAAARLRRDDGTVAAIARSVGYGSESALSNAFKRLTGLSPRAYRASRTP